jgi:hypothetical protein
MHTWGKTFRRIPDDWREAYKHRTREELARDVELAFDRLHDQKLKMWFLTFVLGLEGAMLGWMANSLIDCLELGHKVAGVLTR